MKKRIGLENLREHEVPAALDAKILAAAAFHAARNKKRPARRQLIAIFSSAAAASFAVVAGVMFMNSSQPSTPAATRTAIRKPAASTNTMATAPKALPAAKKSAELEKMQDFTGFEQTAFVLGQINADTNWENFEDSLI